MTGWKKKLGIGCGGLLLILIAGVAWLWIAKPWVPEVELAKPGVGGQRISGNGIIGNYYAGPANRRSPAVLLLGGSEGGLGTAVDQWGRELHKQGYAVLVLSYYRLPGQPQRFELVPLETFYKGLEWLAKRNDVDPSRIAIVGASKGAEAALLVAARRPDVRSVVAAMPSHIVWNGFDWSLSPVATSSWSEAGKAVPYLPITGSSWNGDVYSGALAQASQHPEAVIPVERINGPILLICGEADSLWPSCLMARNVQSRLEANGKSSASLLAYRDAGHLVFGMPVPPRSALRKSLDMLGGTVDGNAIAREDSWPKMLRFLQINLSASQPGQ
jgi:uncharacterized protein